MSFEVASMEQDLSGKFPSAPTATPHRRISRPSTLTSPIATQHKLTQQNR